MIGVEVEGGCCVGRLEVGWWCGGGRWEIKCGGGEIRVSDGCGEVMRSVVGEVMGGGV